MIMQRILFSSASVNALLIIIFSTILAVNVTALNK